MTSVNGPSVFRNGNSMYGPGRTDQADAIKKVLQSTNVLQEGEYNFTENKLKDDVWMTTANRDFLNAVPDLDYRSKVGKVDQFDHHFELNHTNETIPENTYKQSATRGDFDHKVADKVKVLEADRVVNWPDMAPQYRSKAQTGQSEYGASMGMLNVDLKGPEFPRLNAGKSSKAEEKQPIQKKVNFEFGTDGAGFLSENQRVYGRVTSASRRARLDDLAGNANDAMERSKLMKKDGTRSNVFRNGDYNGIVGDFVSTNTVGYGPKTKAIGLKDSSDNGKASSETEDTASPTEHPNNKLTEFARMNTVPDVYNDAKHGRSYQEQVHFQFGHDPEDLATVYNKDYVSGSTGLRKPVTQAPPSATNVIQFDPAFAPTGNTSAQVDFLFHPAKPTKMAAFGLTNENRDNIKLSGDVTRHAIDRQASLAHDSYRTPPSYFKAMAPRREPRSQWDYLQTDSALPYKASNKDNSENTDNFFGAFMYGASACQRRFDSQKQCKERVSEGKSNHFTIGEGDIDQLTETKMQFTGAPKSDSGIRPAGKMEIISKSKFAHLDSSKNTQDLLANDAYKPSMGEPVTRWTGYQRRTVEPAFNFSVMKSDFIPLGGRTFTDSQQKRIEQCERLPRDWPQSHMFHTDHTGNNPFVSTAMMDFVKPDVMPGPKRLAAL